jgi:signal transduction histidine kinase
VKPATILVVDDDDHVRDALVDELGDRYRVDAVNCGAAAFDALAARQYDVVISDLKMPDHDGIEVLEFARAHQRDAIRVLLTGYLDDRAQRALMSPDAPYKVGKPWHDEVEVTVRRALEHREIARRLTASVDDALRLANFDDELAATRSAEELAELVVHRALTVEGVSVCQVLPRGKRRGTQPPAGSWKIELPIDSDGELRVHAVGIGDSARQVINYLAHRAQRRCGVLQARVSSVQHVIAGGERHNQLLRQATLGALSSALLHDLASTIQSLSVALADISALADPRTPGLTAAVTDASTAGDQAVQLFVQMRKFIRDGEAVVRPMAADYLIERALRLVGGYVRERATVRCHATGAAGVEVDVAEALFLQVLGNLLRNAANASPKGGAIDVEVVADADEVSFTITDDGPGVAAEIADSMFEPFASATDGGTGLGLAISAYVVQLLHGRISYQRHPSRGACFAVAVPRSRLGD